MIEDLIKGKQDELDKVYVKKTEPELKRLTNITFTQGNMGLREYTILLGEFKTYYHQRIEAETKIDEILSKLRKVKE
jgi:hypothetical protein